MFNYEQRRDGTYNFEVVPSYNGLQPPQYSSSDFKKLPLETVTSVFDTDSRSTSSDYHSTWLSGLLDKFLIIASTLIPLTISSILLGATVLDLHSTGLVLNFILYNRATAQIIVSIASAIIATLNIYTITKLVNLATRIHLLQQALSLNKLKFIIAALTGRFVHSLPAGLCFTSGLLVFLFALPNTLWTGALTPVVINATAFEASALKIPQFPSTANKTWAFNPILTYADCNMTTNSKGTFSNCPVDILQSSLLSAASQATSDLAPARFKTDNSQYSYTTRSYGVGSPVGIVDDNIYSRHSRSNLLSYKYSEPGYLTSSTCFRNTSSTWHLKEIQPGKSKNGIPYIYYAIGHFPNNQDNHTDFFSMIGMAGNASIVALSAKRYANRTVILITAGSDYDVLNQTQCEISFVPTMFNIHVDVVEKLITVQPGGSVPATSFDPTGKIAGNVIDQINGMGSMSNSLYSSNIGDALMSNIAALNINSTLPSPELFSALDDSLSVMMDGLLLFISSSQFFDPNAGAEDFFKVDAHLMVQAVRFGQAEYVFLVFSMCGSILLAVMFEAYRTGAWRGLPRWDFADTTSLVLASAVAGNDILEVTPRDGIVGLAGPRQVRAAGEMQLRLGRKVLAKDEYRNGQGGGAVSFWTNHARDVVPLDIGYSKQ
jgi:hypothetical protein